MNTKKPQEEDAASSENTTKIIDTKDNTLQIDIEKAKQTAAVLIVIRGTPQGKRYLLQAGEQSIGRDKTADIQLTDANISRVHARVKNMVGGGYLLEDAGSRNGTFLNDKSIGQDAIELKKEDMIRLGSTVLKFLPAGELETLYHLNLTNAAYVDKLTQVYNRNYISEVLEAEFKRAVALHTDFSIIIFDIDNFKKINDTYGHDGGDYILRELALTVRSQKLRERDLVGRYGGEEFLVILPGSPVDQAAEVAERIRKAVESHEFLYEGKKVPLTISLGVAGATPAQQSATDIYKEADRALYYSKHNGKNKVTKIADVKE